MSQFASEIVFRPEQTFTGLDLNTTTARKRFQVSRGQGVTLYVRKEFGSWSTATLAVRRAATGDAYASDFTTAKTVPAGGGSVRISSTEMIGVDELELAVTVAEGAAGTAHGSLVTEERAAVVSAVAGTTTAASDYALDGGTASSTYFGLTADGGSASSSFPFYAVIDGGDASG